MPITINKTTTTIINSSSADNLPVSNIVDSITTICSTQRLAKWEAHCAGHISSYELAMLLSMRHDNVLAAWYNLPSLNDLPFYIHKAPSTTGPASKRLILTREQALMLAVLIGKPVVRQAVVAELLERGTLR